MQSDQKVTDYVISMQRYLEEETPIVSKLTQGWHFQLAVRTLLNGIVNGEPKIPTGFPRPFEKHAYVRSWPLTCTFLPNYH